MSRLMAPGPTAGLAGSLSLLAAPTAASASFITFPNLFDSVVEVAIVRAASMMYWLIVVAAVAASMFVLWTTLGAIINSNRAGTRL